MAASSGDDIPTQLAALLGRETVRIRKTDEEPPRISVIDVAVVITGKDARKAAQDISFVKERHPDVAQILGHVKFADARGRKGQKDTPVTDARGIVEILMLLPGHHAAMVRRKAAELLVRYLGGDMSLISEVCALRGIQEQLSAVASRGACTG